MNDLAATITAVATLVAAIGALAVGWRNSRAASEAKARAAEAAFAAERAKEAAEASRREIIATKDGVFEVGKRIDGRLSELLKSATALARAEGIAAGEQAQRDRGTEAQK